MGTEGQVSVRFRDCTCPGSPHDGRDGADDGDVVYMRPVLGFAAGAEALRKMGESDGDVNRIAELVGPTYIREGVTGWNVIAEDGGAAPLDVDSILDNFGWAYPIADKADDLYSAAVLAPLLQRMSAPSGNGQTGASTHRTRRSSGKARSPRARSSPNGTAGPLSVVSP
jgi:hypothetical protein